MDKVVDFMKVDKKNYDSKINLILLKRIGKTTEPGNFKISVKEIKNIIKKIS